MKKYIYKNNMDLSGVVFIILLPLLSLFIGLIILGAFAFKLSPAENLRPTRDIYSSPYARLNLQELAAKEYEKIDKIKNLNKLSNRKDSTCNHWIWDIHNIPGFACNRF